MATTIRVKTVVQPDGTIEVSAPGLAPGQEVTVSIETEGEALAEKRRAADILAELPGHLQFQTAEEVDAYIREERDSWER
jgi:hypothetical protein